MENAYRNKYSAELYLAEGKNHILNLAQQEDIPFYISCRTLN